MSTRKLETAHAGSQIGKMHLAGKQEDSRTAKLHNLKNLHLKTVVRECHGAMIVQLEYHHADGTENRNLFATIGRDCVTIYDDQYFGSYVGVVAQVRHLKGRTFSQQFVSHEKLIVFTSRLF